MLHLHLRDVLRAGSVGPIRPGATRRDIYGALGPPDEHFGPTPWHRTSTLWRYGDLEAHFFNYENAFTLWMWWCDHIPLPGAQSASLELDPWVLGGTRPIAAKELEEALWGATIAHTPAPSRRDAERELRLDSGWRIGIGHPDAPELHEQVAFIQLKDE